MAAGRLDFTIKTDVGEVQVRGLKRTLNQLRKLGISAADIRGVTKPAAQVVAANARRRAPVRSGRLKSSIKGVGARTRIRVQAGRATVPYAGPIEWGWPKRNIVGQRFMTKARDEELDKVEAMLERGILELAHKHGFKIR